MIQAGRVQSYTRHRRGKMETTPLHVENDIVLPIIDDQSENRSNWKFFGERVPKAEIVFGSQVVMLYIVIIVCLVNLTMGNGDSNLWTALLSSSLGYMLPSPTLKTVKRG